MAEKPQAEDWEYNDLAPIESLTAFGSTSARTAGPGYFFSDASSSDMGPVSGGAMPASYVPGRNLGAPGTEPEPPPPPSIESLTKPPAAVQEGLSGLMGEHIRRQERLNAQTEARLEEDRARTKRAYDATGIQPGEFQPWDADKQKEKYSTAPLEAFGSLGSVFAMVASAFTRDPMTNALNGAAAAMTAVRDGDEKNYVRAYDAWKSNTDLAVKRHNIQQQAYTNAITLMDSDLRLGTAKAAMEAARFGDQKSLFLINNGMIPEWVDLQIKNAQAAKGLVEASEALTLDNFRQEAFKPLYKQINEQFAEVTGQTPAEIAGRKLAIVNHILGKATPVPQEAFGLLLLRNPDKPIEQVIKQAQDLGLMPRSGSMALTGPAEIARRAKAYEEDPNAPEFGDHAAAYARAAREVKDANTKGGTEASYIQRRAPELIAEAEERGELLTETEAQAKAKTEWANAQRSGSRQAQGAATFEAVLADVKNEHPDWTDAQQRTEANRREAASKNVISGNEKVKLQHRINNFGIAIDTADKIVDVVERRKGAAGIAGKVMRLEERLGNLLGSKSPEYVQMMRDVELLRGMAKELIFSKNERLKAEGQRINDIIAGTSAGDTGPNTIAALRAAKKLFERMRSEDREILEGRGPGSGVSAPPINEPPKDTWTPPAHDKPLKKSSLDEGRVVSDEDPFAFESGEQYAADIRLSSRQDTVRPDREERARGAAYQINRELADKELRRRMGNGADVERAMGESEDIAASVRRDRRVSADEGRVVSDAIENLAQPGQRYAAEARKDLSVGSKGGEMPGGGGGSYSTRTTRVTEPEILSPSKPTTSPKVRDREPAQFDNGYYNSDMPQLEKYQRSSLGPMWKPLHTMGYTHEQLMQMTPRDALNIIKRKTLTIR